MLIVAAADDDDDDNDEGDNVDTSVSCNSCFTTPQTQYGTTNQSDLSTASRGNEGLVCCVQVISLSGRVLGTGELSVIDDTVIIDRLDVELVSGVQLSVEAKSDFPGAIAAQVTKTYRLHSYLQVLSTLHV